MKKNLFNELVTELNNHEITYALDVEQSINDACEELGIEPNENIDIIKAAYKKCTGMNLDIDYFATKEEKRHEFNYRMISRIKMDFDYYLKNDYFIKNGITKDIKKELKSSLKTLEYHYSLIPIEPEWLTRSELEEYRKIIKELVA